MVIVDIGLGQATVRNGSWHAADPVVQAAVDRTALAFDPIPAWDPDPDLTAARRMVDARGGQIVHHVAPPPMPDGTVF